MLACVGGALEGEAVLVAINTSDRVLLGLRLYMTAKRGAVARGRVRIAVQVRFSVYVALTF